MATRSCGVDKVVTPGVNVLHMARLENIRCVIDQVLVVHAGHEMRLEHLVPPELPFAVCTDSFVIQDVVVPIQEHQPDEMLTILVGGKVCFSWPIELLVAAYRRWSSQRQPEALVVLQDAILSQMIPRALAVFTAESDNQMPFEVEAMVNVLKAATEASGQMITGCGHQLGRSILLPPRQDFRVETSSNSPLKVFLRGLRSTDAY